MVHVSVWRTYFVVCPRFLEIAFFAILFH
jgi:hypothetical protein